MSKLQIGDIIAVDKGKLRGAAKVVGHEGDDIVLYVPISDPTALPTKILETEVYLLPNWQPLLKSNLNLQLQRDMTLGRLQTNLISKSKKKRKKKTDGSTTKRSTKNTAKS